MTQYCRKQNTHVEFQPRDSHTDYNTKYREDWQHRRQRCMQWAQVMILLGTRLLEIKNRNQSLWSRYKAAITCHYLLKVLLCNMNSCILIMQCCLTCCISIFHCRSIFILLPPKRWSPIIHISFTCWCRNVYYSRFWCVHVVECIAKEMGIPRDHNRICALTS